MLKYRNSIVLFFSLLFVLPIMAQNGGIKSLKIAALQSTTVAPKGAWYANVSYRMGSLADNDSIFFKPANHNFNIQLVYGIAKGLQLGVAWESLRSTYSYSAKIALAKQADGAAVDITAYGAVHLNSELSKEQYPFMKFPDRLSYTSQVLFGYTFGNQLFLEIAPTLIRQNLVWEPIQKHVQGAVGMGGSFRATEHIAIHADYVYHFNRNEQTIYKNPFTLGISLTTHRFLFEFVASTAQAFNQPGLISNAKGLWFEAGVYPSINIVRKF